MVIIPLAGVHAIEGNLWVVLLPDENCVEIHLTREPQTYPPGEGDAPVKSFYMRIFVWSFKRDSFVLYP